MAKLRSRSLFVPGEFQMIHPEAGQASPWQGSFNEIVARELAFRRNNPALTAKNGWSLSVTDVEADVDSYNAHRMIAAGYLNFVDLEGDPEVEAQKKTWVGRLVGAAARVKNAAGMYADLFGPGGKTVPREEAERRAAICVACPLNKLGGFTEFFVEGVAKELLNLLGMLKDLNLTTTQESKLGVCAACYCPTRAKVFVELSLLAKHTTPDALAKFDPGCWILSELAQAKAPKRSSPPVV